MMLSITAIRFDTGLRAGGHTNEIVDLYASGFDPVLRERGNPDESPPDWRSRLTRALEMMYVIY